MSLPIPTTAAVLQAADAIIAAFRATATDAYFAGFSTDATFIFHPEPHRLNSRSEYEALWADWIAAGWTVQSCDSTHRHVQAFPGGAVFTHTVSTAVHTADGDDAYVERESIVFAMREDHSLIAVHEHLSTTPDSIDAASETAEKVITK